MITPFRTSLDAETPTVRPLAGTLPVRPFSPDGFLGQTQVDGQTARVAALACYEGKTLLVSLVGYDTSVSATLAQMFQGKSIPLMPKPGLSWPGPLALIRRSASYKQFSARLSGTAEVHVVALSLEAHISEGLLTPPEMAHPDEEKDRLMAAEARAAQTYPNGKLRFVLANWDEDEPHQRAFLANLYAMRVILLHHRDPLSPERVDQWARALWERGLTRRFLVPVEALGVKAWAIVGTAPQWNRLIGQGVREGWLPWRSDQERRLVQAA